jgi:hypothetical protein
MPAPKGNEYWKLQSKYGRDKLFASPDLLWKAAIEYFEWCNNNPWYHNEQKKGNTIIPKNFEGEISEEILNPIAKIPTQRPFTLSGLCLYLGCNEKYFNQFVDNSEEQAFSNVIAQIRNVIETQQFEGAIVGAFKENIIARKLGLTEKTENKNIQKMAITYEDMNTDEP